MIPIFARSSWRHLLRHPAQLALAVLGIAVGVAVVVGIDTANASAMKAFRLSSRALSGDATHVVRGGPSGVPEQLYAQLALDREMPSAAPIVAQTVALAERRGRSLDVLGVDPFAEAPFRSWTAGSRSSVTARALTTKSHPAFLLASTARELGLEVGAELALASGSRRVEVAIAGTLEPQDDLAAAALADVLVVDIASAQELLEQPGVLTRIDLRLSEEPERRAREIARITELLPPNCVLEPASARAASLENMAAAFETNLSALSLLALLVGVFLVYDTMTFAVVQRRSLWGILRALGASRGAVFRIVAIEALAVGAAGSALGLAFGVLLAQGLVKLVTQTVNDLYFAVHVRDVAIEPEVLVKCALLGIAATLAGALAPAYEATTTQPRAALDRSAPESKLARRIVPMAIAGVAIAAATLATLWIESSSMMIAFVAMSGLLLGAALLVPLATVALCRVATPLFGRIGGQLGRIAARGVSSHLSRTAIAIAALSFSLAATAGIGIMVQSFRGTVTRWLVKSLPADVYVATFNLGLGRERSALDPQLVARLRGAPGVVGCSAYRDFELDLADGRTVYTSAVEMDERSRRGFEFLRGSPDEAWRAFESRDAVLASESLATRLKLRVGSVLEVRTLHGVVPFEVAAVFRDYSGDQGLALMSQASSARHFDAGGATALGLFLAPGADVEAAVVKMRELVGEHEIVRIRSADALRAASLEVFERTFDVTRVLRWLACTVAFLAVLCSLLAIELEREREFGVLRAIGLEPGELRAVVLGQTGLMGAIAGLIAMPIGIALSLILIFTINARAFGWTLELELPPLVLLEALGLAVGAALLAGLWPAWRMSRIAPARALRAD